MLTNKINSIPIRVIQLVPRWVRPIVNLSIATGFSVLLALVVFHSPIGAGITGSIGAMRGVQIIVDRLMAGVWGD